LQTLSDAISHRVVQHLTVTVAESINSFTDYWYWQSYCLILS